MPRAEIQLVADIKAFKQRVGEGKEILQSLGDVEISDKFSKKLSRTIKADLEKSVDDMKDKLKEAEKELKDLVKAGDEAFDSSKVAAYMRGIKDLKGEIDRTKTSLVAMGRAGGGMGVGGAGRGGGGAGGGAGGLMMLGGPILKIAAALGITTGLGALYGRAQNIATQRLKVAALTGGGEAGTRSEYGFTPEERRMRAVDIAQQTGREMTEGQINEMVDVGELAERAFGVTQQQQAGFVGAARRGGGGGRESKLFGETIQTAFDIGLRGARVGEFLEMIANATTQMADGIDVDQESLRGFASALGTMDFFKANPARIERTRRSLEEAFSGGDRFQQAQAMRAMQGATDANLSPAAMMIRRNLGLFFGQGPGEEGKQKNLSEFFGGREGGAGGLGTALGVSGEKIIRQMFQDIMKYTEGMTEDQQAFAFMQRTGLMTQGGLEIFRTLLEKKDITGEMLEQASKSPEMMMQEKLITTYTDTNRSLKTLNASVNRLADGMAIGGAEIVTGNTRVAPGGMLGESIGNLVKQMQYEKVLRDAAQGGNERQAFTNYRDFFENLAKSNEKLATVNEKAVEATNRNTDKMSPGAMTVHKIINQRTRSGNASVGKEH